MPNKDWNFQVCDATEDELKDKSWQQKNLSKPFYNETLYHLSMWKSDFVQLGPPLAGYINLVGFGVIGNAVQNIGTAI
mgnify:CR=1 FL=1